MELSSGVRMLKIFVQRRLLHTTAVLAEWHCTARLGGKAGEDSVEIITTCRILEGGFQDLKVLAGKVLSRDCLSCNFRRASALSSLDGWDRRLLLEWRGLWGHSSRLAAYSCSSDQEACNWVIGETKQLCSSMVVRLRGSPPPCQTALYCSC